VNSTETLIEKIAAHPFMREIPAKHIEVLAHCAMEVSFHAGELIFRQGDPANRFYLLQSGKVQLEASNGRSVIVQTIGGGDVLGWSWLFPPYRWQFDARAIEPCSAIFLYGSRLREICEENTDLGYDLLKTTSRVLIERLQAARRELLKS
jgi:CRP-like cAMP-binding protein